jgi:hypothetical protein
LAALRGFVESDRRNGSSSTRLGTEYMRVGINTWSLRAITTMLKDGSGYLILSDFNSGEEIKRFSWGPDGDRE